MSALTDIGRQLGREQRMKIEQRGDELYFYIKAIAWIPVAL